MKAASQIISTVSPKLCEGTFTRKEAGILISNGCQHIHSFSGTTDPFVGATRNALEGNQIPTYTWEIPSSNVLTLSSSQERSDLQKKIFELGPPKIKKTLVNKINTVFEELATNAIYHSYQNSTGKDKYPRRDVAELCEKEKVVLKFGWAPNRDFYLSVQDRGGFLKFERVAEVFERCYSDEKSDKIETKEGGAGLGLYMVFETVNHLKIEVQEGVSTTVSCSIAENSRLASDTYSFNFFTRRT